MQLEKTVVVIIPFYNIGGRYKQKSFYASRAKCSEGTWILWECQEF